MMSKTLGLMILILGVSSCARTLEKDYRVVDASKDEVPEWVSDLDEWLDDEEEEDDFKSHKYYIYSTEPKSSQSMSCELAKAKAASSAAAEISTYIKNSLAQSVHGDPNGKKSDLSEYIQNNLLKEVEASLVGAQIYKTYWEKRRFEKEKGALKDWDGYVCTSLIKVSKEQLKIAFERTQKALESKVNNSAKEEVKNLLEKASKKYTQE